MNDEIYKWEIKGKSMITYILYGTKGEEHTHEGVEIVYIVNGNGEHIIDGVHYAVRQGSVIFVNVGQTHSFSAIDNFEYYNLLFDPAFIGEEYSDCTSAYDIMRKMGYDISNRTIVEMKRSKKIERVMQAMFVEDISREANYQKLIKNYIEIVLNYLARQILKTKDEVKDARYANIDDILVYIDNNIERKITLEEVSKMFGYAPEYFTRVLKRKYNLTFKQLVLKKRISRAIDYLIGSNEENIDDIAKKCGFSNMTFFYEKFEEYVGLTPGQIRKYRDRYHDINKVISKYLSEMGEITGKLLL